MSPSIKCAFGTVDVVTKNKSTKEHKTPFTVKIGPSFL